MSNENQKNLKMLLNKSQKYKQKYMTFLSRGDFKNAAFFANLEARVTDEISELLKMEIKEDIKKDDNI